METELQALSQAVGAALLEQKLTLACAESCTGGWVAMLVTASAGSSAWFDRGFVTYSNKSKEEMLGVSPRTLASFGAVSEETAREMARGALARSEAGISLAVSGIAGPGGGSAGKPVGTVCFAWCRRGEPAESETQHFDGDRETVRRRALLHALGGMLGRLKATAKTVP